MVVRKWHQLRLRDWERQRWDMLCRGMLLKYSHPVVLKDGRSSSLKGGMAQATWWREVIYRAQLTILRPLKIVGK